MAADVILFILKSCLQKLTIKAVCKSCLQKLIIKAVCQRVLAYLVRQQDF